MNIDDIPRINLKYQKAIVYLAIPILAYLLLIRECVKKKAFRDTMTKLKDLLRFLIKIYNNFLHILK